jgi:hypothetical protein
MKIYGLTACVGDNYALYLKRSLPRWRESLDRLLVVTDEETFQKHFAGIFPSSFLVTDIFTRYGASFNKGAALSEGFANLCPTEWVLNFDADALPPKNWRSIIEGFDLQPRKLFGCSHRYRENGSQIPDADFPNIWGFMHLWNVSSPFSWHRPVFDPTCGHAGNYDHTFMMQWPVNERVDLWPKLHMIHQGEPRQSWFGRDPKGEKKMANLFMLGLWDAWASRAGHIAAPQVEETVIDGKDKNEEEVMWLLNKYTSADPFKYKLRVTHE